MKNIVVFFLLIFPLINSAQNFTWIGPNPTYINVNVDSAVNEYPIDLDNNAGPQLDLKYRVIQKQLDPAWFAALIAYQTQFANIPDSFDIGTLPAGDTATFRFVFGPNNTAGSGVLSLEVFDQQNQALKDTITWIINVSAATSIIQENNNGLFIYRVQENGNYIIKYSFHTSQLTKLSLYTTEGKLVINDSFREGKYELEMNGLSEGIYLLNIEKGAEVVTRKIVKY